MAIAEDMRSGLTAPELMEKYQLSNSGLETACNQLLTDGFLEPAEIKHIYPQFEPKINFPDARPEDSKLYPTLPIAVYDTGNGGSTGSIKNISETGLSLIGITGTVGESKTLSILGDELGLVDPFEVVAECRWSRTEGAKQVAGFQITEISDPDLKRLHQLLDFLDRMSKVET